MPCCSYAVAVKSTLKSQSDAHMALILGWDEKGLKEGHWGYPHHEMKECGPPSDGVCVD